MIISGEHIIDLAIQQVTVAPFLQRMEQLLLAVMLRFTAHWLIVLISSVSPILTTARPQLVFLPCFF
jgi:hypothetical protein